MTRWSRSERRMALYGAVPHSSTAIEIAGGADEAQKPGASQPPNRLLMSALPAAQVLRLPHRRGYRV